MTEERGIKYTDWTKCEALLRYCRECNDFHGVLMKRIVTGRDGDTHKEYKIECESCGQKSGVHMSRNLTIYDWEGHQEEPDSLKMFRRRPSTREKHEPK